MKMITVFAIAILFAFPSCNSEEKINTQKVKFGLYETINVDELPASLIDTLKKTDIKIEKDIQQPIIGYVLQNESVEIQLDFVKENIRLVKTAYSVDNDGKYFALVAIKYNQVIDNADIQRTKNTGGNVEIHFNMKGAKKWANMTKNNIGKMLAFTIDNEIYSMPYINDEIRSGIAMISGLKNEIIAKNLSDSLNSSLSD